MAIIFGVANKRDYIPAPGGAHGYAALPGSGPAGKTCADCVHLNRGRRWFKCSLMRQYWTGGRATDIKARSAACLRFEEGKADE